MNFTLILLKPDTIIRGLIGEIISRFERIDGFLIKDIKTVLMTKDLIEKHYQEHILKPFYKKNFDFFYNKNVVAIIIEGNNVIDKCRKIIGNTNPAEALPGTIRGDYALELPYNLVHASDSEESAIREIGIFFPDFDLCINEYHGN